MKTTFRSSLAVFALFASIATYSGSASATIIYESTTQGVTGFSSGYGLWDTQFLGSRFSLSSDTAITSIGVHMGGNGTFFGAIVGLSDPNALPISTPLSGLNILANGTFTASKNSIEQTLDLPITLGPGNYGVIFGTGLFGTSGIGFMPTPGDTGSDNISAASYFFWNGGQTIPAWQDGGFSEVRFVVNGETSNPVPEPATFLLLGAGLAGAAFVRRKMKL